MNNVKNEHNRIKRGKVPGRIGDDAVHSLLECKDVTLKFGKTPDIRTAKRDGKLIREPIVKKTRAVLKERTRDKIKRELD